MLVSILIPCYNSKQWVAQAIESALAQSWQEKEIIVVDDGSTDGSLEEIKKFEGRIYWETGPNRGGNAARNRLMELARGEWLQFLDADDYLMADKIAKQMQFLALRPETDIIFGPVTLEYATARQSRRERLAIPVPHDLWVLLARWYLPQTGATLWRKQSIAEVGGWKLNQPCCQEHELYLRLLMANKRFAYCAENGAIYRQWSEQTVCKRDLPEVHRQRLEIEQRAEDFLRMRGELTRLRLSAINQARFEIARIAWGYNAEFASHVVSTIRQSQPDFVPGGSAARLHYRLMYRLFGFREVERLAALKRRVFPRAKQFTEVIF